MPEGASIDSEWFTPRRQSIRFEQERNNVEISLLREATWITSGHSCANPFKQAAYTSLLPTHHKGLSGKCRSLTVAAKIVLMTTAAMLAWPKIPRLACSKV